MTGDHGQAEDLLQTTLVKIYLAWPRIDDLGAVEAYTRRAIVRTQVSFWRRSARREVALAEVPERPATASGWSTGQGARSGTSRIEDRLIDHEGYDLVTGSGRHLLGGMESSFMLWEDATQVVTNMGGPWVRCDVASGGCETAPTPAGQGGEPVIGSWVAAGPINGPINGAGTGAAQSGAPQTVVPTVVPTGTPTGTPTG